ncbi:MAG TPA: hypothetical protein PLE19_12870 [Planctomycetota bacterium]|nr:hypothetical protein [Planctomycetota bacterium]HRR82930.1 hypothetical protein [Planctomycetota bacterium]HRT94786.1 hypothetical protein [Planctomycetota bacterium]
MSEPLTNEELDKRLRCLGSIQGAVGMMAPVVAQAREANALRARVAELERERDEAREFVEAGVCGFLMTRCAACGHRLRADLPADSCPQCGAAAPVPWKEPQTYPDNCECERCVSARKARE